MNGTVSPRSVVVVLDERGRGRVRRVVGDELVRRVAIEVVDLRRRVALRVDRRAERRVRRVRVAGVGRDLRAGEHRAADRMVGDRDPLAGRRSRRARSACWRPTFRPVTSPSKRPFGRSANALVTSTPSRSTRTVAGSRPGASRAATSASPPEIRSARFDRTSSPCTPLAASSRCPLRATPPPRRRPPTRGQLCCPAYALLSHLW